MGLDPVDFILDVERMFGILIPDASAQRLATVGELIAFIRSALPLQRSRRCPTSRVFYRLRRELMRALPLDRSRIRPAARLADLIPASEAPRVWKTLKAAGLALPSPVPYWLGWLAIVLHAFPSPDRLETVRDAVFFLVTTNIALAPSPGRYERALSDREITESIRTLVSAHFGVPATSVSDHTRFVEDIGL